MNKKIKIAIGSFSIFSTTTLCASMLTSCTLSEQFVFGNFQSYMNPMVQEILEQKIPNINWQYFASNNEIPTYLKNKTINSAVASNNMVVKLVNTNMLDKIDWTIFELIDNNGNLIQSTTQLSNIFSELTYKICTKAFKKFNINLLDYCFPYFLQNFVFVYRGNEIPELSKENVTFTDIFKVLNKESRFLTNNDKPNVMMVKDSRTVYGVSQILLDEKNGDTININPDTGLINEPPNSSPSIDDFKNNYKIINKSMTNNKLKIGLNSDSNVLINQIVLNQINGGFMYNGDAVFAGLGGDYGGKKYNGKIINFPTSNDFHIVVPKNTLLCLDGIIINKENDTKHKLESLKIAYEITVSGANVNKWNQWNVPINISPTLKKNNDNIIEKEKNQHNILNNNYTLDEIDPKNIDIMKKNENDEYIFLPTMNFDYVNYTPTLLKLYNQVTGANGTQYFKNYLISLWTELYKTLNAEQFKQIDALSNLLSKAITLRNIDDQLISNYVEMPLNTLSDSNLQRAFGDFTNGLPG